MSESPLEQKEKSNGSSVPEVGQVILADGEATTGKTVWDFLMTPAGGAIASSVIALIQSLQKSTIEANAEASKQQLINNAEQQKQQIQFQHGTFRFSMYLQGGIFLSLIAVTYFLAVHDKLSGAASTVICTTLGYLFGRTGKGQ